jgi:hypothetical protein
VRPRGAYRTASRNRAAVRLPREVELAAPNLIEMPEAAPPARRRVRAPGRESRDSVGTGRSFATGPRWPTRRSRPVASAGNRTPRGRPHWRRQPKARARWPPPSERAGSVRGVRASGRIAGFGDGYRSCVSPPLRCRAP